MKKISKFVLPLISVGFLCSCEVNTYNYENYENYITSSNFTITTPISQVEVTWVNGNINFLQGETTSISVREENYGDYPLYYCLEETTLKIEFIKNGTPNSAYSNLNKDLYITLPLDIDNLITIDVNTVNGNCNFDSVFCKDVNLELVNGDINFNQIAADEISLKMVNGNVDFKSGATDSISIAKVNGNSTINNLGKPAKIDIESVNGVDTIYVPEFFGYKVQVETIGTFSSEYDNLKTYGNALVVIDYEGVNGTLIIKK